jgi:hypothetical protein
MHDSNAATVAITERRELPPVLVWPRYSISDFENRIHSRELRGRHARDAKRIRRFRSHRSAVWVPVSRPLSADRDDDDSTSWLNPAFQEIGRVMKNNSFCVSFYGWSKVDVFMAAWRAAGLRPRAHLVWPKPYASLERLVGYCHEQAYLLSKGEPPQPKTILRDVLPWKYTGNQHHPTQKPLIALTPLIEAFSES